MSLGAIIVSLSSAAVSGIHQLRSRGLIKCLISEAFEALREKGLLSAWLAAGFSSLSEDDPSVKA